MDSGDTLCPSPIENGRGIKKKKKFCRLELGCGTDYLLSSMSSILILSLDPYSGENVPLSDHILLLSLLINF